MISIRVKAVTNDLNYRSDCRYLLSPLYNYSLSVDFISCVFSWEFTSSRNRAEQRRWKLDWSIPCSPRRDGRNWWDLIVIAFKWRVPYGESFWRWEDVAIQNCFSIETCAERQCSTTNWQISGVSNDRLADGLKVCNVSRVLVAKTHQLRHRRCWRKQGPAVSTSSVSRWQFCRDSRSSLTKRDEWYPWVVPVRGRPNRRWRWDHCLPLFSAWSSQRALNFFNGIISRYTLHRIYLGALRIINLTVLEMKLRWNSGKNKQAIGHWCIHTPSSALVFQV